MAGTSRLVPKRWAASTRRPARYPFQDSHEGVGAAPRHDGRLERLWFGENRGDRIGMFDTRTQQFKEWQPKTPGWPYDVIADRTGEAWSSNESTTGSFG